MAYDLVHVFHHATHALEVNPRISLRALAQRLQVERHTLERAFRKVSGKPFRRYRQEVLMQKSLQLLASYDTLSIKEIAYSLGYKSPRAFSRLVYLAFGCCPSKLREQLGHGSVAPLSAIARKHAGKGVVSGSALNSD